MNAQRWIDGKEKAKALIDEGLLYSAIEELTALIVEGY